MKTSLIATAALAAVLMTGQTTAPAFAHDVRGGAPHAHGHVNTRPHTHPNARVIYQQIRIKCFRGPLAVTAWDHPEAIFVDDLVAIGYDNTEAWAIGNRVCKDSAAYGSADRLRASLQQAIAQDPPDR